MEGGGALHGIGDDHKHRFHPVPYTHALNLMCAMRALGSGRLKIFLIIFLSFSLLSSPPPPTHTSPPTSD